MRADTSTSLRVGVVMVLSLTLLLAVVWTLGQRSRLFRATISFQTRFRNVAGLQEGSDVRLAGFRIGHISDISLPLDFASPLVIVKLDIEKESSGWIRSDTTARLKTLGLLGDKYIELTQGSAAHPVLEPGSDISAAQPIQLDALLESGENIADNLLVFSSSLRKIAERIEKGEGLVGEIVRGSPRARELLDDFSATLRNVSDVFRSFHRGEGTAGLLFGTDPKGKQLARDIRGLVANLRSITDDLNNSEGILGKAISEPEFGMELVKNLTEASAGLRSFTDRVDNSEGVLARLLDDKAYADELLSDVRRAADSVQKITDRVASGEGSLGKLMVDETLYTGLNDILAGAHKSRLTRWILLRSQKQGVEERLEAEADDQPAPGSPH
jgi:phospholipid/cholesterol/gamma-HCH transport system substrate-binding protein